MAEKEAPFTSGESLTISSYAKEIARSGEEAIFELVRRKSKLSIAAINTLNSLPANEDTVILGKQLIQDVRLMDEVIRQARAIRQVMGLDEFANLTLDLQEKKVSDG